MLECARSSQALQVRKDVVHVLVRVFRNLLGVRLEPVDDRELHAAGGPRSIPAGAIAGGCVYSSIVGELQINAEIFSSQKCDRRLQFVLALAQDPYLLPLDLGLYL